MATPSRQRLPRTALLFVLGLVLLGGLAALAVRRRAPADPRWRTGSRGEVHGPIGEALDSYLRRVEAFGYSGSVLVARQGQILLDAGYGWADEAHGEPYTADTQFDIASVSKQFTAAAILELEREGRLSVEDTLSRFLPNVPADKAGITLHQLLTHTGGLPYALGGEYDPATRSDMLRRAFAEPLLLAPGRRFRYSNVGYSVLAAVAEVVSGRPLGEFMREKLFLPAGMQHTGFRLPLLDRRQLAHGYGPDGPWGTPLDHPWADDGPFWNLRGNGGVISTTGDLYRWHLALAAGTVLSAPERAKFQSPHIAEGRNTPSRYAYGWSITKAADGTPIASHTGGNGIFETDFRRYFGDQTVLVVSSNHADYSGVSVAGHLENRLFKVADPDPPSTMRLPTELLQRCSGTYSLTSGEKLRIREAGSGLQISGDSPATFGLLLAGQNQDERDVMAERDQKVGSALAAVQKGDLDAVADLYGAPLATVGPPFRASIDLLVHQLGAWTGSTVLGSVSIGGYAYTYASLHFANGSRLAQYSWDGPTVGTQTFPAAPLAYLFLPEQGAQPPYRSLTFGSYDVRTGAAQHLMCVLPASGPALSLEVLTGTRRDPLVRTGGS